MNNLISINDTDKAAAEFLKLNNISFSARYNGTEKEDKQVRDRWSITIGNYNFDFFTGSGHRLTHPQGQYKLSLKQIGSVEKLKDLLDTDRLDCTVSKLDDRTYAVKPTQASVLYCLLSDADCGEGNFIDFCDNFGYDQDSRKAFNIYEACCENYRKMRGIFTHEQREQLREMLQDY